MREELQGNFFHCLLVIVDVCFLVLVEINKYVKWWKAKKNNTVVHCAIIITTNKTTIAQLQLMPTVDVVTAFLLLGSNLSLESVYTPGTGLHT